MEEAVFPEDAERLEALDGRVRELMSRMAGWVESQLVRAVDGQQARTDAFEERVRTVVSRLTDSVEALASGPSARPAELEILRAELLAALDAHLADTVEHRRAELESLRAELQEALTSQLADARAQIAAAVAGANKRFVRANDQLRERIEELARRTSDSAGKVDGRVEARAADGRRVDELEQHARRTDERLAELLECVETGLAGALGDVQARTATLGVELEAAVATVRRRVEELASAMVAAASAEAGALAPLRSDVRALQVSVSELAEVLEQLPARRKAAAAKAAPAPKRASRATRNGQ